jgi:ubiquitin carboxyl-terminal hydrolase 8
VSLRVSPQIVQKANHVKSVVGKLQTRFKNSDQQDAQDFLAFFLDGLHEDLNENALKSKLRELTPDEERRRERMPLATISTIEWDRYKHNHKSFLVELFQGQFVSSLKCSVCGTTSTTCNAFMNLSIEISLPHGPQGLKLTQCIDAFVKEEVLEGDDAW